jgi:hypothetical protein
MDDELRLVLLELVADGIKVEQIHLIARQGAHAPARGGFRRHLDEIISNQPVRAGDPDKLLKSHAPKSYGQISRSQKQFSTPGKPFANTRMIG